MKRAALLTLTLLLPALMVASAESQSADWPRTVLITNDDGFDSAGLMALVRVFSAEVKTYVVTTMENRSGTTNFISAFGKPAIEVEGRDLGEDVVAYAVDGYPADAVTLALGGLLPERPDLVISGINSGPNLANAWNLSGTIGAAQIAAFLGVPAIAVSGYSDDEPETLTAAARWTLRLARSRLVRQLDAGGYLTVSIPRVPVSQIQGIAVARRESFTYRLAFAKADEELGSGKERWSLRLLTTEQPPIQGTDRHAYAADSIVVIPMKADEHDHGLLEELNRGGDRIPTWAPEEAGSRN